MLLGAGAVVALVLFLAPHRNDNPAPRRPAPTASTRGHAGSDDSSEPGEADAPRERPTPREVVLSGNGYQARITTQGAALRHFTLTGPRMRRHDEHGVDRQIDMVSTDHEESLPLRLRMGGDLTPPHRQRVDYEVVEHIGNHVAMRYRDGRVEITRRFEPGSRPYQLWVTTHVTNLSPRRARVELADQTFGYTRRHDEGGGFLTRASPWRGEGLCRVADSTERHARKDLEDGPKRFMGRVGFAAFDTSYFIGAIAPSSERGAPATSACSLRAEARFAQGSEPDGDLFTAEVRRAATALDPGQGVTVRTLAYFGPKDLSLLTAAGHDLPQAVNLGFFSFIARGLLRVLQLLHNLVGNWGLAIILLTVMVKLVLLPVTARQFKSMEKMRELKPELDRINELYKDEKEKKQAALMELYRTRKINPAAGCLPALAQLPVWWALYTTLQISVELYRASFTPWWTDLSSPDPYYVMPLFLGVLMYVQQKITPTTMDPTQAKIMQYLMPAMFTVFMLFLPIGLCLYMTVNSSLSILQQQAFMRRMKVPASGKPSSGKDGDGAPPTTFATAVEGASTERGAKTGRRRPRGRN